MASNATLSESDDEINQNKNKSYSSMQAYSIGNESDSESVIKYACRYESVCLDDFESNIAHLLQIYQSKVKTITLNFVPGKKDDLREKDDQRTVIISPVVKSSHTSDLPIFEDGLKHLAKPNPLIQSVIEETGEHIVAGTEEPKNTDPVVVIYGQRII
ncbi:hypothetical protein TNCT_173181 [Trichonephila clavata]|uniref:Uncharacterized protein n=1 Tax=Trichonephila clavata TaxID=2740835 RepID=A0A8X6KZX3_TRICU|nr:hypothetical protein TNCT_173181 [Trichonephila clavata]